MHALCVYDFLHVRIERRGGPTSLNDHADTACMEYVHLLRTCTVTDEVTGTFLSSPFAARRLGLVCIVRISCAD